MRISNHCFDICEKSSRLENTVQAFSSLCSSYVLLVQFEPNIQNHFEDLNLNQSVFLLVHTAILWTLQCNAMINRVIMRDLQAN